MSLWPQKQNLPIPAPSPLRYWLRKLRNLLLIAIAVCIAVEVYGVPHLRWEYQYRGSYENPIYISGEYVSPIGWHSVYAGQYADGCPLILWLALDRPVYEHALDTARCGLRAIHNSLPNGSNHQETNHD